MAVSVAASPAHRTRQAREELEDFVVGTDRYLDMGIVLHVVEQDEKNGFEAIAGKPLVRILRSHRFGGILDRRRGTFIGPTRSPVTWYCSESQEPFILHRDHGDLESRVLIFGTPGAGKTEIGAMWVGLRVLELTGLGCEIGATAPTRDRLAVLLKAFRRWFPRNWYRYRSKEREMYFANGCSVILRATKQYSEALGSPLAGLNLAACFSDEIQDSLDADGEIESRGRAAPVGFPFRRMCTSTAKQTSVWKTFVAKVRSSTKWVYRILHGKTNAFVSKQYWRDLEETLSTHDYQTRILLKDHQPEFAVYPSWKRARNVRQLPAFTPDCAERVLAGFHSSFRRQVRWQLLVALDPGKIKHTAVFLRPYIEKDPRDRRKPLLVWYVVGEFIQPRTSMRSYAKNLRDHLRAKYQLEYEIDPRDPDSGQDKALIVGDPHINQDEGTDEDAYIVFRQFELDIVPATSEPPLLRNSRIDMMNRLMWSDGAARLVAACDKLGQPLAPEFVDSVESLERDAQGKAETDRKNLSDKTHGSVATGYGLWPLEREAFTADTQARAIGRLH